MPIHCPKCGAEIPAAHVNVDQAAARCPTCNIVFDISGTLAPAPQQAPIQRRRAPAPMPPTITVHTDASAEIEPGYRDAPRRKPALTIVRRWYTPSAWLVGAFCVFWNAFLMFWYRVTADAELIFKLFPLIHVGAGVYMTYRTLATFFNTTTITVTDDELTIRHRPVPWPGNKRVPAAELAQLFTEEQISEGKNGVYRSHHLSAVMKDGRKQRLLTNLPEPEQGLFLEQQIEERLGIVDVEVGGEWQGRLKP